MFDLTTPRINDMMKYMKCLLNGGKYNGTQLLKKETLETMMTTITMAATISPTRTAGLIRGLPNVKCRTFGAFGLSLPDEYRRIRHVDLRKVNPRHSPRNRCSKLKKHARGLYKPVIENG